MSTRYVADERNPEDQAARPLGGAAPDCKRCGGPRTWYLSPREKHGAYACCAPCRREANERAQAKRGYTHRLPFRVPSKKVVWVG